MSGKKRTRLNYQPSYQSGLDSSWALAEREREQERQSREEALISERVSQATARVRNDVARVEAQVAEAERRAAADTARLQELQRQTLREIAGIEVELQVTQNQVQNMQWENQELHRLAAQDRQQIKSQIERSRQENLQWHRIAQEERERINAQVRRNAELIDRNRKEILENRRALNEGLDRVMSEVRDQDERRKLEQMRNAASVIESVNLSRARIPTEWMQLFDPENYQQAQSLMDEAERHYRSGNFSAASDVAAQGLNKMTQVAANVDRQQKAHQRARDDAYRVYDELIQKVGLLDTDEMALWYGPEFQVLKGKLSDLKRVAEGETYTQLRIEDYNQLRERSLQVLDEAQKLHDNLQTATRQHFERRENAKRFIKALAVQGDYRPLKPVFRNPANPHSDLLLQTEEGLRMSLALNGEITTEFPSQNIDDNVQWMEKFNRTCEKQGFAQLQYEALDQ